MAALVLWEGAGAVSFLGVVMADVTVTVTTAFDYRGRQVSRGSRVAMAPVDAAIHARQGHVTLVVGQTVTPDPEPDPEPAPRSRRRYRRRDLVAEG